MGDMASYPTALPHSGLAGPSSFLDYGGFIILGFRSSVFSTAYGVPCRILNYQKCQGHFPGVCMNNA